MAIDKPSTITQTGSNNASKQTGTNVVALPTRNELQRPSDKVIAFVKEHPVLTVAGGVAVGVAIAALLPRKAGGKLADRAFGLAQKAAAASALVGGRIAEKVDDASSVVEKKAGFLAHQAERLGEAAGEKVGHIGHNAYIHASSLGHGALRQAGRIGNTATEHAHRIGDAARAQSTRFFGYPKPPIASFTERLALKAGELRVRIKG